MRKLGQQRGRSYVKVSWKMTPARSCMRRLGRENSSERVLSSHASAGHPPAQGLWRTGALSASPLLGPLNTQAKGLQRLEGSPLEAQKLSVVRRQSTLKPTEDTETVKPSEGNCLEDRGLPC